MKSSTRIVHVSQPVIRSNAKNNERNPPIIIRQKSRRFPTTYASTVDLVLDGRVIGQVVYSPDKPLDCGAKVYIQSDVIDFIPHKLN